jgi:hypothetical protein
MFFAGYHIRFGSKGMIDYLSDGDIGFMLDNVSLNSTTSLRSSLGMGDVRDY